MKAFAFSLDALVALAIAATLAADVLWYFFGSMIPWGRLMHLPFLKRRSTLIERLTEAFRVRGLTVVFLSKFIYGTRIIAQVIAGAHRLPFWRYLAVNTAGIVVWNSILLSFVVFAHTSATIFDGTAWGLRFGFIAAVVIVLVLNWIAKRLLLPRLLPPHGPDA